MKIILDIPPGAKVEVQSDDKGQPTRIEIEPAFPQSRGKACVASGTSITKSRQVVDRFQLQVSGVTGKLIRVNYKPVVPAIDAIAAEDDQVEGNDGQ